MNNELHFKPEHRNFVCHAKPSAQRISVKEKLLRETEGIEWKVTSSTLLRDAEKEFWEAEAQREYPFPPEHSHYVEQARDWSALANQLVGQEDSGFPYI